MQKSYHAEYLKSISLDGDVKFCSRLDSTDLVPIVRDGVATLYINPEIGKVNYANLLSY